MTSENQDPESLLRRVEAVERQNRRLKLAGSMAFLAMAGALCLGVAAPSAKNLDAEKIILRDAQGKARMILVVTDEGPAITLLDRNGKLRANLGVTTEGPALDLLDAAESPRAQLMITEDQGPLLNFFDRKGKQVTLRP